MFVAFFNIRKDIYKLFTTKKYAHLSFRNTKSSIPSKWQHTNFHFYAIQTKIKAVQLLGVQFCLKEHTVDWWQTYGRLSANSYRL